MVLESSRVDLPNSIGYLLKEVADALRAAMDEALRPLGLTVTRYACLEILDQRPGLTGSELARGIFVTRQSMNVVLHDLERAGLLARPATPPRGRALPAELTAEGRRVARVASELVRGVERRMLGPLSDEQQQSARELLGAMHGALRPSSPRVH